MHIAYTNGKIFTGERMLSGSAVLTESGNIVDVVPAHAIPSHYSRHDLGGYYLSPSFIDMQIYGGNGKMFSHDLSIESLEATYAYCLSGGATHFMVTMATNTIEKFVLGMEIVKSYWQRGHRGLLGLHLEGPYINPVKRGAHVEACIKKPSDGEIEMLLKAGEGVFKMMTLAPEMCEERHIARLLGNGILVSAGHTNATYEQSLHGFRLGIPVATHLFNAMSALQHREAGMVGALFNHPSVSASLVCDGIHVNYAAIQIAKKMMGHRLFYITDAVAETRTGEYQHIFRGDRYTLPDGTLSGSALTMMQCVKNGVEKAGITLEESLRMATVYPAQYLSEKNQLGQIVRGFRASFVIFDDAYTVQDVIVA